MEDRLKALNEVKKGVNTHSCPSCTKPTYCAMEAGKSASNCWCLTVESQAPIINYLYDQCQCRECLKTYE